MENSNNQAPTLGFINGYKVNTLENNWNEDRFDLNYVTEHKPILSNFNHNYETTYKNLTSIVDANNKLERQDVFVKKYRLPAYPGYQPELNLPEAQRYINTYETDQRVNYLDPKLKMFPIDLDKMLSEQLKEAKKQYH